MSDFQKIDIGGLDDWRAFYGGFVPERSRHGRFDYVIPIGLTDAEAAVERGSEGGADASSGLRAIHPRREARV